jgi:RNA polymerase sigma factor (sigma-70 family)
MGNLPDYLELSVEEQDALIVTISFVAHDCAHVFTHRVPSRRDTDLAADLAQEVVLSCLTRLRDGRWKTLQKPLVLPLVLALLQRRAVDRIRRGIRCAKRERLYVDDVVNAEPAWMSPDLNLEEKELAALHRRARERIPPAYREAHEMVRDEECTYREVARRLGISPLTVTSYVTRARRQYREELLLYGIAAPVQIRKANPHASVTHEPGDVKDLDDNDLAEAGH